ncbi:MAG: Do family serine endopeptidase [Hyphomicrobiaceae bacterium]|nr:Do family serine endopeptidase [Hyphomicrobiaceae bacterium]
MQVHANEPDRSNGRRAPARSWLPRASAGAAVAAVAGVMLTLSQPADVAFAQKADAGKAQTIETPFGRAPLSFADIVDKVKGSVVSISVTNGAKGKDVAEGGPQQPFPGLPNLPDDHPLNEFFKNLPKEFRGPGAPGGQKEGPRRPSLAQGSGFVISADGYVVTNNHVIDGASEIEVRFDEDEKYAADLVGTDPRTDLALLKIKNVGSKEFKHVRFADKPIRVGDWVIAVGNPFGLGGTVTAGIVSALSRDIGSGPYDYLQIDAAVNRGNSGGPTFNLDGEVVGVNTAIFSPSGGNVGIAFAVPATTATDVVEQLKRDGTVSRGWLGVKIQNIDEDTAASLGLDAPKGALVSEVTAGGPAADAGLKAQDAILKVDAEVIADSRDLARKVAAFAPGVEVKVEVWRNGERKTVPVKLGRFPSSQEEIAALNEGRGPAATVKELGQLGLELAPTKAEGEEGVAIAKVADNSDAARKGLKQGDVILEVQGVTVATSDDVVAGIKKAIEKKRPAVLLHVKSGNDKRFVAVLLKKD